ncbi:MAG TPA: cbb3-type cytochrome c oxidase subunit 3 [Rhodanobacteraceae bacterium]
MNPVWGHVIGVITVIMMVTFLAIWYWAWRKYHKPTFDRMAAIPMEDDIAPTAPHGRKEKRS